MSREVAVSAFALWTPAGVWLDRAPDAQVPETAGAALAPWPQAPLLADIHPRARRPHPHAVALVQLAHALLGLRAAAAHAPALPREQTQLLLGSVLGSTAADREFHQGLAQRGTAFGSPSTFVYTLSTAGLAEVALALGLRGALATLSAGRVSGLSAVARAAAQIAAGSAPACLCGGVELSAPGASSSGPRNVIGLFLLEPAHGSLPWPRLQAPVLGFGEPSADGGGEELQALARALVQVRAGGPAARVAGSSLSGHQAGLTVAPPPPG